MKAFRITEKEKFGFIDIPEPAPGDGDVLIEILKVGLCGTDLSTFRGGNPLVTYPRIPGHEIAGAIRATGKNVPEQLRPGMHVTVIPYTNCGQCASCRRGRLNACKNNQTLGVQRDGAMTKYIAIPWQKVLAPEGMSLVQLALVEPMTVGFHAVARGSVAPADAVLVLGCGMIGLGCVAGAAERGARVIAADLDGAKLEKAARAGAQHTLNTAGRDWKVQLDEWTHGMGPDVVIEAVGSPATYRLAVEMAAFTGRIVCIGYAKDDAPLPTKLFVQKELDILGSRNATPEDFQRVLAFFKKSPGIADMAVTRTVPLEETGEALRHWSSAQNEVTKILVNVAEG